MFRLDYEEFKDAISTWIILPKMVDDWYERYLDTGFYTGVSVAENPNINPNSKEVVRLVRDAEIKRQIRLLQEAIDV